MNSQFNAILEFALKNRVCLVKSSDGYEVDISLGIPGYEEEVIRRAVDYDFGGGHLIKICSAEDLIPWIPESSFLR